MADDDLLSCACPDCACKRYAFADGPTTDNDEPLCEDCSFDDHYEAEPPREGSA